MKTFLDNTGVHQLYNILSTEKKSTPIKAIDAIALFHFAENILFANEIEVSAFESQDTIDFTNKTVEELTKIGCIIGNNNKPFLKEINFSINDYKKACDQAALKILDDLIGLDKKTLINCSNLSNESTRPLAVKSSPIQKWILKKEWSDAEKESLRENAIHQKAKGAYDYIICSNDPLYQQLKILTSDIKKNIPNISQAIDVIFRVAINQELAAQRCGIYSPAPQRSKIIYASEQLFRGAIEQKIVQTVSAVNKHKTSKLLESIKDDEKLPLPIFAIHFLRKYKIHNPTEMLEISRKLRDDSEVISLRNWLTKWEYLYSSTDIKQKQKALDYLNEISYHFDSEFKKYSKSVFSVFRGNLTINPDGSLGISPDFSGLVEFLNPLFRRFSRRKIFLSTLTREFALDKNLGKEIIEMLGRAVIT